MSALTEYARRVPLAVLKAHVITGAILLILGCLMLAFNIYSWLFVARVFVGFLVGALTICAGATALAGGVGRSNTQCCIVSCLVLGVLTAIANLVVLIINSIAVVNIIRQGYGRYLQFLEYGWLAAFGLAMVVAGVQSGLAIRASCCCVTAVARDVEMRAGHPMQVQPAADQWKPPAYDNEGMRSDL